MTDQPAMNTEAKPAAVETQVKVEALEQDVERIETGGIEAAEGLIDSQAQGKVVEVKDYTKVAEEAEFPEVSKQTMAMADAYENQIKGRADQAKKEVAEVMGGGVVEEAAPAAKAEEAAPAPKAEEAPKPVAEAAPAPVEAVPEAKVEETAPAPAAEEAAKPKAEEAPPAAKAEAPAAAEPKKEARKQPEFGDLFARSESLINEFKADGMKASKIMLRKLIKLMAEAHPDKFPGNPEIAKFSSMLGRLKMAMDGDTRSWARGGLEADFNALKPELLGSGATSETAPSAKPEEAPKPPVEQPTSAPAAEAPAAEQATAGPAPEAAPAEKKEEVSTPEQAFQEYSSLVAEVIAAKGKVSIDAHRNIWRLMGEMALNKAKGGEAGKAWSGMEDRFKLLNESFQKYFDNPVGLMESLNVVLSENPDFSKAVGVDAQGMKDVLKDQAFEMSKDPDGMAGRIGGIALGVLRDKGKSPPDARALGIIEDELTFMHQQGEDMSGEKWQQVRFMYDHLMSIGTELKEPIARLEALSVFATDFPEAAAKVGLNRADIDRAIEDLKNPQPEAAPPPSPEAVSMGGEEAAKAKTAPEAVKQEQKPVAEDQAVTMKLEEDADSAFTAGDEKRLTGAVQDLESHFKVRMADRQAEMDSLAALSVGERTPAKTARMQELKYANEIDDMTLTRRKVQLELVQLQKEKQAIDLEVAKIQEELKSYQGAQDENLLAAKADEGKAMVLAGPDKKKDLDDALAAAMAKQSELADKMSKNQKLAADLADNILQLSRLLEKAKAGQVGKEGVGGEEEPESEEAEAKTTGVPEDPNDYYYDSSDRGYGGSPGGHGGAGDKKPKLTGEDVIQATWSAMLDPGEAAVKITDKIFKTKGQ